VLGTQMERHSARRNEVPATVISCPAHVTDFPARYAPFAGWEGANVIFDAVTHTLTLGLESHLIEMFREMPGVDHDSVLGSVRLPDLPGEPAPETVVTEEAVAAPAAVAGSPVAASTGVVEAPFNGDPVWSDAALAEMKKIPFFVRKKAMLNTEKYARAHGIREILPKTIHETRDEVSRK
jgi:light-independent protochlorophyllide reductase subunit B